MATRALHVSDLHAGRHDASSLAPALAALVAELAPELVLATGDLSHRGQPEQLARAREILEGLGAPFLAVPGNHDIPYTFPARVTRPWRAFERQIGPLEPTYRSETLVVCGLNSVRPWAHQGGRLRGGATEHAADVLAGAAPGALRVVALHHHLAGAPWRVSRKRPLAERGHVFGALAAAGAELVVGGHIHQASVTVSPEFDARTEAAGARIVLATAPGSGRPRPHRPGEAVGALAYAWDADSLTVTTYALIGDRLAEVAERSFPRRG